MSDNQNGMDGNNEPGGFSLESILAEIKGTAFINGDKKTPPDLLQEKADKILREAAEMSASSTQKSTETPAPQTITSATLQTTDSVLPHALIPSMQQPAEAPAPQTITSATQQTIAHIPAENIPVYEPDPEPDFSDTDEIPMIVTPLASDEPAAAEAVSARRVEAGPVDSPTITIPVQGMQQAMQNNATGNLQNQDTLIRIINDTDTGEAQYEEEPAEQPKWGFGRKNRSTVFDQDTSADEFAGHEQVPVTVEEEEFIEPELRSAVRKFAAACNSISIRVIPASVITLLMILITYVFEAGMIVPFGIGYHLEYAAGALIICLLIVMMLCSDVIVRGVDFLIRGIPNAETLVLFSCVFSIISAAFTMISGAAAMLPFCAVSAMSVTFAAHGEKYNLRAITDTLKTAVGSSEPYGVQAEYNTDIDKSVLKKAYNRTDGFYNNLMQPDITELLYRYAAPVILIGTLLLTVLIILVRGGVENSLHIMSALLAAAAPFSALLSFSVPFATVVKSTRKSGAAIAGWGGADDICYTDGVCVTDDDLFPPGMLRLSGVKVYDGASPENAIRYTASLILSSGSGLTSLFAEVLKQQGLSAMRVDNFECHESGIGALIRGEQVSTGSAAFMNLLGVRVPDDTSMKNAVYTAVNNRLVAMFAIDYKPLPSVQSALISMLKWRIDLFFAMRDFNVTPAMVGQKFKVPFDSFVFIPAKDSYKISDLYSGKTGRMAAVLIREGLNPFAEAITGGRLLKAAAFFGTVLSIVSAALGVLIMFYMCWTGSFLSASPGNLIVFMLCMLATVLIVCGYVRLKK